MSHRASAPHLSPFMPEDLGRIVQAGPPILMPGGDVLYPATRFEDGARRVRLARLRPSGDPDNLYDGEMADPALSSDGRRVAFVGHINGEAGVALLDVETRAVRLLTRFAGTARAPQWSPDGSRLLVEVLAPLAEGPQDPHVVTRVRYDLDGLGYLGSRTWSVYVIDVATGFATAVGTPDWHHFYPAWAPEGRRIALITTRRPDWDIEWVWDLYTVNLDSNEWRLLTPSDGVARMPVWSKDGRRIAFFHNHTPTTSSTYDYHLMVVSAEGSDAPRCLSHAYDRGSPQGMVPFRAAAPEELPDGRFLWYANVGGRLTVVATDMKGHTTPLVHDVGFPTAGPDGLHGAGLVYLPDRPPEVCRFHLTTGDVTVQSDLNPWLRERRPVRTPQLVTLDTEDGPVENWVWEPEGEGPHPTLLYFHGGPHGAVGPYFQSLIAMPVTHGYAVGVPNFRGSGGYGQAFADLIRDRWGTKEGEDGAALAAHLISAGVASRGHLGVYGGSYGGFMTNWMVTRHPELQQAAVTIATISDLATLSYGIDHWESIRTDVGGPAWAIPDSYREHSPITHVDRVQCPVLILHGGDDRTCPPYEAEMWFVALRWQKKPVTWVEYPGEGHVSLFFSGRLSTLTDLHRRTLDWFDRYLRATTAS